MMGKVFIKILETDGLKAALEAERTVESIVKKLRPFISTYKTIHLDDFEIKQLPRTYANLETLIKEFLNEH